MKIRDKKNQMKMLELKRAIFEEKRYCICLWTDWGLANESTNELGHRLIKIIHAKMHK